MASSLKRVTVAPKGMGLNDFVAQQEGFFAAEGLDVELAGRPSAAPSRAGRTSPISIVRRTSPMPRAAT